jgi:hypothetical protein
MLRLCLIAAICIVGFTAAQFSCTAPAKDVYAVTNYTAAVTCRTALCSCLGGSGTTSCTVSTKKSCADTAACTLTFISCMNGNSTNNTELHMSLLAVASGELYNTSVAYTACRAFACSVFNTSAGGSGCSTNANIPYDTVCKSNAVFRGTLRLAGNYTAILRNATAKELLRQALEKDLTAFLGFPATVTDLQEGSLVVLFEVPVSGSNSVLAARIVSAGASATWLTGTKAQFQALGGDPNTITVLGVGATTPAPQPATPSPPSPPSPPTPAPPVVTPAPRTSGSVVASVAQLLVAVAAVMLLA